MTLHEHYTAELKAFMYKSEIDVVQDGDAWRVDAFLMTAETQG